jgi:bifunctional enzyme CysN/CysC
MSTHHKRKVVAAIVPASLPAPVSTNANELTGIVRVLTCGSVDDGKSTLLGRLLWDASDLFDDQREMLRKSTRRVLDGQHLDYSLLVDGLLAEREQGITIDIAWRYFDTAERRFVLIDSPGHEQYTRNMASGASHADVAVMLIDARHGIKRQTKRHAALLDLFGVRRVVLAVNKMDLVDWSEARFAEIERDFRSLASQFRFAEAVIIPVAAVTGDNIARRSATMAWYAGPTLLEQLNASQPAARVDANPFRMPIQTVLRDGQDFRGLAGTVTSGQVAVGETIVDCVSGASANVARIVTMSGNLSVAQAGQAVALVLDRDIDVSRGAVLSHPGRPPVVARNLDVRLVWLSDTAFDPAVPYLLRTATDLVPTSVTILSLLDLETLASKPAQTCVSNDIAVASVKLARPVAVDRFADEPGTGNFLLIDPVTGATVAGGTITDAMPGIKTSVAAPAFAMPSFASAGPAKRPEAFRLTRAMLLAGICADLADQTDSEAFARRTNAVIELLRSAGVTVDTWEI